MLTTIHDDTMMTKVRRTHRAEGGQEEVKRRSGSLLLLRSITGSWEGWTGQTSYSHIMGQCFTLWPWLMQYYTQYLYQLKTYARAVLHRAVRATTSPGISDTCIYTPATLC